MADDSRDILRSAVEGVLTPEHAKVLIDDVLASTKRVNADWTCKFCKKTSRATVEVPDAKVVGQVLPQLLNQFYGRPGEAASGDDEKIIFKRIVKTSE